MKMNILLILSLCLFFPTASLAARDHCQEVNIVGSWTGTLNLRGKKLRFVIHVKRGEKGVEATADSPDQGATGLFVDSVGYEKGVFSFEMKRLQASFTGKMNKEGTKISGRFKQRGADLPLIFEKGKKSSPLKRPQEPKRPFPYLEEEVSFGHSATESSKGIRLAGTLTMPKNGGPHPAVVLISGSGPQNRDETLMGHKPFLVPSDALTRRGIAVLRYDDRGVGKSTGDFKKGTSADFADDAFAAFQYLRKRKEIAAKSIGLIGHSEGGLIAPMLAAKSKDIAFVVLLAGPAVTGEEIILAQTRLILAAGGADKALIEKSIATNKKIYAIVKKQGLAGRSEIEAILGEAYDDLPKEVQAKSGKRETFVKVKSAQVASPWFRYFLSFDPRSVLPKLRCPVLILSGAKDLQVPPAQSYPVFRKLLADHPDSSLVTLPKLNHLFQHCKTGAPSEYGTIEETFAPIALRTIGDWLEKRFLR